MSDVYFDQGTKEIAPAHLNNRQTIIIMLRGDNTRISLFVIQTRLSWNWSI